MTKQYNPEQLEILQVPEVARRFEEFEGGIERLERIVSLIVASETKAQARQTAETMPPTQEISKTGIDLSSLRHKLAEVYNDQKAA